MKLRTILFATLSLSALLRAQGNSSPAQPGSNPAAPADNGVLIRTESNLVLVDTVVTDKKGNYLTDLKEKDFKVSEDGKDQPIKSFSYENDPASGAQSRTHYLVLLFDNSSMSQGDQVQARQAAAKFVDNNAGPNRMMSIINFGGEMRVLQNFTSDTERLKAVVNGVQNPSVRSNSTNPAVKMEADFAARDLLQSLRAVSKNLSTIPGRKILVLFTAGFPLTRDQQTEATATIAECNRDNVAIYPVDVRGLSTAGAIAPRAYLWHSLPLRPAEDAPAAPPTLQSMLRTVALVPQLPFAPQRGGGGAPAGGGGAGSAGGSRSAAPAPAPAPSNSANSGAGRTPAPGQNNGSPANNRSNMPNNNNNNMAPGVCSGGMQNGGMPNGGLTNGGTASGIGGQPGMNPCAANQALIPKLPPTATSNQQIMYMLAEGTGGFVIANSNDLIGGLEKIGAEQNQYYILGYTPPEAKEGACHTLKVKVDRGGTEVRARTGYCSAKPMDVLSGTPVVKGLEAKMAEASPGKLIASMRAPYFYTTSNVARVNLAMEIAADALKFEKRKGNVLHSEVNFLGIAYTPQGTVAARFSDTLKLDFTDKQDADEAKTKPLHYENQFDIASGKYTLKVVYTEGNDSFGKLEMPLEIGAYSSDVLAVSALALSKSFHRANEMGALLDVAMLEDKTPLIADGLQIVPTGNPAFGKSDLALFYVELYEPLLVAETKTPAELGIRMRVLDRKTGEEKNDTGFLIVDPPPPPGNQVVHLGAKLPVSGLPPGAYKLEFTAADAAGKSAQSLADFDIQ